MFYLTDTDDADGLEYEDFSDDAEDLEALLNKMDDTDMEEIKGKLVQSQ